MSRVLLVSSSYPFTPVDFHARFVHDMAVAFRARGDDVAVLTPAPGGAGGDSWEDGVRVRRFPYAVSGRWPVTGGEGLAHNLARRPWRATVAGALCAAFVVEARRALDSLAPDVVIAHWLIPAGLALHLAAPHRRAAFVAHGSDVRWLAKLPGGHNVLRWMAAQGPVLSTSPALSALMRQKRLLADPSPWHLGVTAPAASTKVRRQRRSLVAMGRLIEGKGFGRLLDVAAHLPDHTVRIAGDGPLRQQLSAAIEQRGLSARVELVGPVLGEAKTDLLASAELFAFLGDPSGPGTLNDNLPVSVLEALAAGCPVIATHVGAMPELLVGGGGVLVDAEPSSIAERISAIDAPMLSRLSAEARALGGLYSWEASLAALDDALTSWCRPR